MHAASYTPYRNVVQKVHGETLATHSRLVEGGVALPGNKWRVNGVRRFGFLFPVPTHGLCGLGDAAGAPTWGIVSRASSR